MAALTLVVPALQHLTFQPEVGGEVLINFVPNAAQFPLKNSWWFEIYSARPFHLLRLNCWFLNWAGNDKFSLKGMVCLVVKWSSQLPPSLLSAQKAPAKETKLSEAPARSGRPGESWDGAAVTSALRHFHSAFPAHPGREGSAASTRWLFMAPPLGTRLCETPTQTAGSKTQTGSSCAGGFAFPAWAVLVSFSQSLWGEKAEIQPWELSDCWASAVVHLTHLFCHLKSLLALLLALPERLKNSFSVVFHFPVWVILGIMLSSTLKCCKGWRWNLTFD